MSSHGSFVGLPLAIAILGCAACLTTDCAAQRGRDRSAVLRAGVTAGRDLEIDVEYPADGFDARDGLTEGGALTIKKRVVLGGREVTSGKFSWTLTPREGGDGAWVFSLAPKRARSGDEIRWVIPLGADGAVSAPLNVRFTSGEDGTDAAGGVVLHLEAGALQVALPCWSADGLAKAGDDDPVLGRLRSGGVERRSGDGWRSGVTEPDFAVVDRFDPAVAYYWSLLTSEGLVVVRLRPDIAPRRVAATVHLTDMGFYDRLTFHRVMTGFMAQGGCPTGDGNGTAGFVLDGEFDDGAEHDRPGIVSMANSGPGTESAQFFITFAPAPHLDGKHTIFGEVVRGMAAVHALEGAGSKDGPTTRPLTIEEARVYSVPAAGSRPR